MKENVLKNKTVEGGEGGGGGWEYWDCVRNSYKGELTMQLSLQFSRLDKVTCYSTFCDDQFSCLIFISIFVMSDVFENSSLTGVGFFSRTYYYTYKKLE